MERFAGKCYLLIVSDLEADDSLSAKAASNHFPTDEGCIAMTGFCLEANIKPNIAKQTTRVVYRLYIFTAIY